MKRFAFWFITGLFICLTFTNFSAAQESARDPVKEEKVWQELEKTAPETVEKFKAATAALDAQNYEEAVKLYNEVIEKTPDFDPALRRLGYALSSTEKETKVWQ